MAHTAHGEIWVGTRKGLYAYLPQNDSCRKLSNHDIKDIVVDSRGEVWIGTWSNGLHRYSPSEDKWVQYPRFGAYNSVHVICEDSYHRIWFGKFGGGITVLHNPYDVERLRWTDFTALDRENPIIDDYVYAVTENPQTRKLWFGTRKGICITDVTERIEDIRWTNIYPQPNTPGALPFSDVDALFGDDKGNLWVGMLGGGVCLVKNFLSEFHCDRLPDICAAQQFNSVRCMAVDEHNRLWMGVGSGSLVVKDLGSGETICHDLDRLSHNNLFTRVQSMAISSKGKVMLGSQHGIYCNDVDHPSRFSVKLNSETQAFNVMHICQIVNARSDGYWVAGKNLLAYYDGQHRQEHILLQDKVLYRSVLQESDSLLWIASSEGILRARISDDNRKLTVVERYDVANGKMPVDSGICLYEDSHGRLWVGTDGAGLCCYLPEEDRFVSMNRISDFPVDMITSIIEDGTGSLWMGSNMGLVHFFPRERLADSECSLYGKSHGLVDNKFLPGAVCRSSTGEIFFGTHNGYVRFHPREIVSKRAAARTFITDLKLDNHSYSAQDSLSRRKICDRLPGYASQVKIPWRYSNFTIEFSPMVYSAPDNVRYAYKLEGYDKDWQYPASGKRFAHYANLPADKYRFRLLSTDEYGHWSEEEVTLGVEVIAPLWKTRTAYVFYLLVLFVAVFYLYFSAKQRMKLRTEIRLRQIEQEKSDEVNQAKLRFFTNITHELFTPITIITVAAEEIRSLIPPREAEVIISNTRRLTRLIQQILEFRKVETGNLKLQVSSQPLSPFIARNIESFRPLMRQKMIDIMFVEPSENDRSAYFDSDKLDKILYNLLSNALKYNSRGAQVCVSLEYVSEGNYARIVVRDNGEGLSERTMKNLFKRFYDGDFRKYNTVGTGIGLSLVHDLVVLHKGTIEVENTPGKGVAFIIELPVSISHYNEEECNDLKVSHEMTSAVSTVVESETETKCNATECSLLVVEDHPDLLHLLRNVLSRHYRVFTATDGVEAVEVLRREDIGLVVSDVMMPRMDGYELCREMKKNIDFNHIPVVLLTAKVTDADAVDAYDAGADAYMTKPFSPGRLEARIRNLLEQRARTRALFREQKTFAPQELNYTSYDESFLQSVLECINANYSDSEFDQNRLADLLNTSRSTLHRKLKSLVGMTASNLIKDIRLKCAYKILQKERNPRVSDVAYAVGFNDPRYFSSCFSKEFGIHPSEVPCEEG